MRGTAMMSGQSLSEVKYNIDAERNALGTHAFGLDELLPGQVWIVSYLQVRKNIGMLLWTYHLHGSHRTTTLQVT